MGFIRFLLTLLVLGVIVYLNAGTVNCDSAIGPYLVACHAEAGAP